MKRKHPMKEPHRFRDAEARGFTLIELLAAAAIMAVILMVIFGIIQQTGNAWRSTSAKIDAFQAARASFDALVQTLGQATLNPYYDYYDASGNRRTGARATSFLPASYGRQSDLHFACGSSLFSGVNLGGEQVPPLHQAIFFQTPAGYSGEPALDDLGFLLNACGYFLVFSRDPGRPSFLDSLPHAAPDSYRFRLMQFLQPSQNLQVYASQTGSFWFQDPLASADAPVRQMAENIIVLLFIPRYPAAESASGAPTFSYDSRAGSAVPPQTPTQHQLPPLVEVVMVAIDDASARRLENGAALPDCGLGGLFADPGQLESDLTEMEKRLGTRRITYRVFRTTVALRNARWSS